MRTAFRIASKATPTSAITASHKVATPPAPKISTTTFIAIASEMFCHTMFLVIFPIFITDTILEGWSFWITTSAVSMVASLPSPPIAMPASARATTGASFTPIADKSQPPA